MGKSAKGFATRPAAEPTHTTSSGHSGGNDCWRAQGRATRPSQVKPPAPVIDWKRTAQVNRCAGLLSQAGSVSNLSGGRVPEVLGSNTFGDIASLATRSGG